MSRRPPTIDDDPAEIVVRASSSAMRSDMLRETCPDDLYPINQHPPQTRPSALLVFGPIFLGVVLLMLVAALHAWLGEPFGHGWGERVWALVEAAIWPAIVAASAGVYVRRQYPPLPPATSQTTHTRGRITTGAQRVIQISESSPRMIDDDDDVEGGRR